MLGRTLRSQDVSELLEELFRSFVCIALLLSIYKRLNVDRGAHFSLLNPLGDAA